MDKYTFDFLQDLNPDLVQLGRNIENIFYEDPHGVFIKGRLFAEILLKDVVKKEKDLGELHYVTQVERIVRLEKEGVIDEEIAKAFDTLRYIGNKAAHESTNGDIELAIKIHRSLFKIAVWYMEVYGDLDFQAPQYSHPSVKNKESVSLEQLNDLIQQSLNTQIASLLKQEMEKVSLQQDNKETTPNSEYKETEWQRMNQREETNDRYFTTAIETHRLHGSSLLYELSKLKESSQEAVENSNKFSEFKKYLHVKRPIQDDLHSSLIESSNKETSQLIFLCGSVGDGKSHLLAYMNETQPELMSQFKIHNDATESFDPTKNSLDTLAEVLKPFSDENIDTSKDKLILAINLGILHNFLESKYAKESYTKLVKFIEQTKLFETTFVTENCMHEHFHLISFSDYHSYELTLEKPKSNYFKDLFNRITNNVNNNPFYQAYLFDVEKGYKGPVITNFQMLMRSNVQEALSQLLIQAIIKYKIIISTRALLNFIYDILVPVNLEDNSIFSSVLEETECLLPNLLFGSSDKSVLLKVMSKIDPIHKRTDNIDKLLIELNNSSDISDVFKKYLNTEGINPWIDSLKDLGPFYEQSQSTRQLLNMTLIRLSLFLSDDLKEEFNDQSYVKYMKFLYAFNVGVPTGLRDVYKEVETAIFYWKGQPIKDSSYIYMDESVNTMKIAQELKLKPDITHLIKREDVGEFSRFKSTLVLAFQDINKSDSVTLEIDFSLYEKIVKVLNGYRPNKKDKEDAIQFIEFIDKIMKLGRKQEELLIHHLTDNIKFKLEYDGFFEQFTFKRE